MCLNYLQETDFFVKFSYAGVKLTFSFSQFSWDGPVLQIFDGGGQIFIRFGPGVDFLMSLNPWLSHATNFADECSYLPLHNLSQIGVTFGMGRFFRPILSKISTLAHSVEVKYFFIRFFVLFFISWVHLGLFKCKNKKF